MQKNEKINILSVPFINLNFPTSSGAKKRFTWMAFWPFHQHLLSKTYLYVVTWLSPCEATRRTYASLRCVCMYLQCTREHEKTQSAPTDNSVVAAVKQQLALNARCVVPLLFHKFFWPFFCMSLSTRVQEKGQKKAYSCIRHAILN